jgi:quinol monooxygenase YgiN
MAEVSVVAKLTAAQGKADELRGVVADLVASVREAEPETLVYAAAQDDEDPNVFWFYEFYGSEQAFAAHSSGAPLATAGGRMRGLLGAAPEVHRLTPIAASGLPA